MEYKSFTPDGGPHDIEVCLDAGPEPPEKGRRLTPEGKGVRVWEGGGEISVEHGAIGFAVDPASGTARVYTVPEVSGKTEAEVDLAAALSVVLGMLLHHQGLYGLHAVGLWRGGRGYVFSGRSDSGKSTTALALVRHGWHPLSDDSLLIQEAPGGRVSALGMRRDFCVDPSAAARFPELSEHTWPRQLNDPDKWRVDVGRLYGAQVLESCEPEVLLFPEVGHCDESRLDPMAPAEALSRLLEQSAFALYRFGPTAPVHFAAFGALVRQCAVRRLVLGRDVFEDTERFSELLLSIPGGSWPSGSTEQ